MSKSNHRTKRASAIISIPEKKREGFEVAEIVKNLKELDGILNVSANYLSSSLSIEYDNSKLSLEDIRSKIE